jgi:hypothetical protein
MQVRNVMNDLAARFLVEHLATPRAPNANAARTAFVGSATTSAGWRISAGRKTQNPFKPSPEALLHPHTL